MNLGDTQTYIQFIAGSNILPNETFDASNNEFETYTKFYLLKMFILPFPVQ